MRCGFIRSSVASRPRCTSGHAARVKQWSAARSPPGTVVVVVVLGPALGPGIDRPQAGVADGGAVLVAAHVHLVGELGLVRDRATRSAVALGTADGTAVGEPEAGLAVGAGERGAVVEGAPGVNPALFSPSAVSRNKFWLSRGAILRTFSEHYSIK